MFANIGRDGLAGQSGERQRAGLSPEVEVKIFELAGPVAAERGFDAAADGPAGAGIADTCAGEASGSQKGFVNGCLDAAIGETAGDVAEHGAAGEADAAANGAEPVELLVETCEVARTGRHAIQPATAVVLDA